MIPRAYIQEWRSKAPWPDERQIEQDLIICRVLCDLFNSPALTGKIAFRGGTAINKLLFEKPLRYSEDIDLVQIQAEPIAATLDAMRETLSWLGKFSYSQARHSIHLLFKFSPENAPDTALKVKVEINTREHEHLYQLRNYPFEVESDWYSAQTAIASFEPEELFGTKLRALLQRRKNRDLFDLNQGLSQLSMNPERVIACLEHYLALQEQPITRAIAEQRMLEKLQRSLTEDVSPLLPAGIKFTEEDAVAAFGRVWVELIGRIAGDPWKLSDKVIEDLRSGKIPKLLL
ncbi:MAG TPA: nucleotidyl transferase AbiEii/AbiGii toxin family protein [Candidatus Melainabacteria bacterium]|nr:nucleotidyl transferase AbiEii/AbiGii toxin family protein [Candidatus Melainabacteria bacterium]